MDANLMRQATRTRLRQLLLRVQLAHGKEASQLLMLAEFGWDWAKAGIILGFVFGMILGMVAGLLFGMKF